MTTPSSPPALNRNRGRAPTPSAALLSLQQKGLELSPCRNTPSSVSPQSVPNYDINLSVSPLSIVSTPSIYRLSPAPAPEPEGAQTIWRRRTSDTASIETTITGILNLYTNLSKQSLRSHYGDVTTYPNSDDGSDEDAPPLPMVHQPKAQAYRDTIAPLLEHQFSTSNPMVPKLPSPNMSPMSLTSLPTLMHPDASISVPSLRLTPDTFAGRNHGKATKSETSIQITPEMSPAPGNITIANDSETQPHNKRVMLEVPDVRDAESWYDEPLSPVSPQDLEYRNSIRESQQSAVSPQSPAGHAQHFQSLALESLSPPVMNLKMSPGLRAVRVVDADMGMVPLPLDLGRDRSVVSRGATPVYQGHAVEASHKEEDGTKRLPSLPVAGRRKDDLLDRLPESYLIPPEDRTSILTPGSKAVSLLGIENIERPQSAFSDSSDSYVIHDTISGQVKALWKEKFGKKKDKKKGKDADETKRRSARKSGGKANEERVKSGPTMTRNVTTAFHGDEETYRYPYNAANRGENGTVEPAYRIRSPEMIMDMSLGQGGTAMGTESEQTRQTSTMSDSRLSVGGDPRSLLELSKPADSHGTVSHEAGDLVTQSTDVSDLEYPAIPLTRYQKYGVEIWYESNKKKRRQERERLRKEAEKAEKLAREEQGSAISSLEISSGGADAHLYNPPATSHPDHPRPSYYQQTRHTHNTSNGTSSSSGPTSDIESGSPSAQQRRSDPRPAISYSYNNDLFEASGGRKKSGFASRLVMSSEEKRKRKVKESITIVGGAKMGGEGGGLVKI